MNSYDKGDTVRCTGTFTDSDGNEQDPSAVFFEFNTPAGVNTEHQYGVDAELVKSATGVYYVDIDANAAGIWAYRFYATGSGKAASENKFAVKETDF